MAALRACVALRFAKESAVLILIQRPPVPDADVWPGRVGLAAVDALAWPAGWVLAVLHAPFPTGAIGQFVVAMALVSAVSRLHRAVAANHRYFFTTWTWGRRAAGLILVGYSLKLAIWLGAG